MNTTKLIPFDLERAKAGDPVQTRDGRAVRIICFNRKKSEYPIVGLIDCGESDDTAVFTSSGCFFSNGRENPKDLFMRPRESIAWVNLYKNHSGVLYAGVHSNQEDAGKNKVEEWNFLGTHPVTFTE